MRLFFPMRSLSALALFASLGLVGQPTEAQRRSAHSHAPGVSAGHDRASAAGDAGTANATGPSGTTIDAQQGEPTGFAPRVIDDDCVDGGFLATLPPDFYDAPVSDDWVSPVGLTFDDNGRLYIWDKIGLVYLVEDGVRLPEPLIDISDEVNQGSTHGLLGFALDPDFLSNGFIYLLYAVDKHHLLFFGTPEYDPTANNYYDSTIGRLTRYTANVGDGFTTVDETSRTILIGDSIDNGFPICGAAHSVGTLAFGDDGTLIVSSGDGEYASSPGGVNNCIEDGILAPEEQVGEFRSLVINSLAGKLLRIDPMTGDGVPSNPYYDALEPRAARSRVWALGFRTPHRITMRPFSGDPSPAVGDPGSVYVGDVGSYRWEELDIATTGGMNFGWPIFEGNDLHPAFGTLAVENLEAPNPLFGMDIPGVGICTQEYLTFQEVLVQDSMMPAWPLTCDPSVDASAMASVFMHARATLEWGHDEGARVPNFDGSGQATTALLGSPESAATGAPFLGNCSIAGTWYLGTSFPPQYFDTYFHADFGGTWIRSMRFDAGDNLLEVNSFAETAGSVIALATHPLTGELYYLDRLGDGQQLRRIYYNVGNEPPVAAASASTEFGPIPLDIQFSSDGTIDPEGSELSYLWDFGDGTPPSILKSPRRIFPSQDVTEMGSVIMRLDELSPPIPLGLGNSNTSVLHDRVYPPVGILSFPDQFDTLHTDPVDGLPTGLPLQKFDEDLQEYIDWFGYEFDEPHTFLGLYYQEGVNATGIGGWFETLEIQIRNIVTGEWEPVSGFASNPPYVGLDAEPVHYERFEMNFFPKRGDAIRMWGIPGGPLRYLSVAEMRVLAQPGNVNTAPYNQDVTLTVTDLAAASDCSTVTLSLNNTPPEVTVNTPIVGQSFTIAGVTDIALDATVSDLEHDGQLTCLWEVELVHDNHSHPEPLVHDCVGVATIAPHQLDPDDVHYYELTLRVTDPLGLETERVGYLYPLEDCNLNGLTDDIDFANGTSFDANRNGIPDECEVDCNANDIHDIFELALGFLTDADENGTPDECE